MSAHNQQSEQDLYDELDEVRSMMTHTFSLLTSISQYYYVIPP